MQSLTNSNEYPPPLLAKQPFNLKTILFFYIIENYSYI